MDTYKEIFLTVLEIVTQICSSSNWLKGPRTVKVRWACLLTLLLGPILGGFRGLQSQTNIDMCLCLLTNRTCQCYPKLDRWIILYRHVHTLSKITVNMFSNNNVIPDDGDWRRTTRQHMLQALLLLCHRVSPPPRKRVRTTQRHDKVSFFLII